MRTFLTDYWRRSLGRRNLFFEKKQRAIAAIAEQSHRANGAAAPVWKRDGRFERVLDDRYRMQRGLCGQVSRNRAICFERRLRVSDLPKLFVAKIIAAVKLAEVADLHQQCELFCYQTGEQRLNEQDPSVPKLSKNCCLSFNPSGKSFGLCNKHE